MVSTRNAKLVPGAYVPMWQLTDTRMGLRMSLLCVGHGERRSLETGAVSLCSDAFALTFQEPGFKRPTTAT